MGVQPRGAKVGGEPDVRLHAAIVRLLGQKLHSQNLRYPRAVRVLSKGDGTHEDGGRSGGVFCLELGEWWGDLTDRDTVEHLLRLLESVGEFDYRRRDIGTRAELDHYLQEWAKPAHSRYAALYLAFHGTPGAIEFSSGPDADSPVSLEHLTDVLRGKLAHRVVHVGACSVMDAEDEELDHFLRETGARAISGYKEDVEWVQSAAFDLILLDQLARGEPYATRLSMARQLGSGLADELGFHSRNSTQLGTGARSASAKAS